MNPRLRSKWLGPLLCGVVLFNSLLFLEFFVVLHAAPVLPKSQPDFYRDNDKLNDTKIRANIREMYLHGWKNYIQHAYPLDDLDPINCKGRSTIIGHYLTLIDAADGLALIGEIDEFRNAVNLISQIKNFDIDLNVSVFETTIRYLGGLLSTHMLAKKHFPEYNNTLLALSIDLADRLAPAFNTRTGINYGSINLRHGVSSTESTTTCAACAALTMEFGYLSYLTGNSTYYNIAKRSIVAVFEHRSKIDLIGDEINIESGDWVSWHRAEATSGIAGEVDSYYEYLLKSYVLFHDDDFLLMFDQVYTAVERYSRHGPAHNNIDLWTGKPLRSLYQNLECFWAGLQASIGDVDEAFEMVKFMGQLMSKFTFIPERMSYPTLDVYDQTYILRPEVIESVYYLHRTTQNQGLKELGFEMMNRLNTHARTQCGFAGIDDIVLMTQIPHMESFFLAETLKYLYLLFDENNDVHQEGMVFTTEAHPLPIPPNHKRHLRNVFVNASMAAVNKQNPFIQRCSRQTANLLVLQLSFCPTNTGYKFLS